MIYYFDVKETYIKTVGVEAEELEQAVTRVEDLYNSKAFDLGDLPHEIEFEHVSDDVEEFIKQKIVTPEEIEVY